MGNILEIDSVIKSFGVTQILTDIYIRLQTGDILGIFGRNGTGKSTLLKIIFGTEEAERKFIRLDGKVRAQPYKCIDEICFLPQHGFVPGQLLLHQAVKLFLHKTCVESFFDDKFLRSFKNCKVSELSGGELRYFEIKLILNSRAKFVLLDEPFTGISPLLIEELSKLIKESSRSKGIILTDHDYNNVLVTANRYCVLYDGGLKYFKNKIDLVKWGYINESKTLTGASKPAAGGPLSVIGERTV
jgi:lipopolysaccharide export system ATP-binding protein